MSEIGTIVKAILPGDCLKYLFSTNVKDQLISYFMPLAKILEPKGLISLWRDSNDKGQVNVGIKLKNPQIGVTGALILMLTPCFIGVSLD